jgi:hypothetical protein
VIRSIFEAHRCEETGVGLRNSELIISKGDG